MKTLKLSFAILAALLMIPCCQKPEPVTEPPVATYIYDGDEFPVHSLAYVDGDQVLIQLSPQKPGDKKTTYAVIGVTRELLGETIDIEHAWHNDDYFFVYETPLKYYSQYRKLLSGTLCIRQSAADPDEFDIYADLVLPDGKGFRFEYEGIVECLDSGPVDGPVLPEDPEVVLEQNSYMVDGVIHEFRSLAATMTGENLTIAGSPEEGHSDLMSIMTEAEEFFYVGVSPVLIGNGEFDLKTEPGLYTVISTLSGGSIETLAPGQTDEIRSGKCKVDIVEDVVRLRVQMELSDGTPVEVDIAVEKTDGPIEVNENEIARDDEVKPLRTAFYQKEGKLTYLYFTPANISYFSELSIATWYLYVVVPSNLVNGKKIDVKDLGSGSAFAFGMVDNVNGGRGFEVTNKNLAGISGNFCLSEESAGVYSASFEFTVDGSVYKVWYEGECISTDIEKPEDGKVNGFQHGNETIGIESVTLSKGDEVWTLTLALANGKDADVSMSAALFQTGGTFGFSQDSNMQVSYDGNVYSKANGYSGTLTVHLDESAGTVETEFTNYGDCRFYYSGRYDM